MNPACSAAAALVIARQSKEGLERRELLARAVRLKANRACRRTAGSRGEGRDVVVCRSEREGRSQGRSYTRRTCAEKLRLQSTTWVPS